MSWFDKARESLRRLWAEMDPALFVPPQPELRRLNDDQAELCWQGRPFLFDRRSRTVSRAGRVIARYDAVQSIGISMHSENNTWSVILDVGSFRNVVVGTSREQTDASIAAAQIARTMDKKVRLF
jgi:hypothetical protein